MSYPPIPYEVIKLITLTNYAREDHHLAKLEGSRELLNAAQAYAEEMKRHRHYAHTGPDGSSPFNRALRAGYGEGFKHVWVGENLSYRPGQTAAEVLRGLMNSPGHCENILHPAYHEIGVGYVDGWWVQLFGGRLHG